MSLLVKRLPASAVAGALLVAAAACADRATAPAPARSADALSASTPGVNFALGGKELGRIQVLYTDRDTVTFTVDPTTGGTFNLAQGHFVYFPANAICDPATSSYGPTHWDESCTPATQPIQVTAVSMRNALGAPYVDFQPAMRFAPSKSERGFVWLYMYDQDAARDSKLEIDYCFDGLLCVDEAAIDRSMQTRKAPARFQYLYRRIKHFSGYNVAAGRTDSSSTSMY